MWVACRTCRGRGHRSASTFYRCNFSGFSQLQCATERLTHNQRVLFISNHKHIYAIAFNAKDDGSLWDMINLREKLARVKMVYDLLLNTQAKHYGECVSIK